MINNCAARNIFDRVMETEIFHCQEIQKNKDRIERLESLASKMKTDSYKDRRERSFSLSNARIGGHQ